MPAKTFKIVLKKSRPCFIESACSAAASCAFMTFKFSLSISVISFFTSVTSKLSSTTTLIKLTSPVESRSCCAVLNSNKAKVAPPAAKAKEKPDRIPLPDEKKEKKQIVKKKQNPEEVKPEIRQSPEFEKKEIIDTNQIAALIDKAKEEEAVKKEKNEKLTQSNVKNSFATGLTLSEEDALRAQIFGCWSVPLGLPYDEDLLVRIKLKLKQDGTIMKSEILDHQRMNRPGQKFYKVLAESALRAVRLCQPLKVPPTGYEKWKDIQLNFNPAEMLKG